MNTTFLPENYTLPIASSNYMKLQKGENKIRILTAPLIGWEDWKDKKPVRFAYNEKPVKSFDPGKPVKEFWAFIVWNYVEEKIQILQLTQNSIKKAIGTLVQDADWGLPYFYDIKISRTGDGITTEYTVNPLPHKPVADKVKKEFHEKRCNLNALISGGDPFGLWESYTKGVFNVEDTTSQMEKTA